MPVGRSRARQLWRLLEPVHAVTYFSPEPLDALSAAGFRGFWMGYFAARSAPLGPAGPDLVHALFYNFDAGRVARALPAAWDFASPADALAAREQGSTAALRRLLPGSSGSFEIERAADLALTAALSAPVPGRALYAANRALPVPDDPLARLWHAATLLREHRGDGHVAALLTAGVGGREAHVLLSAAGRVPREVLRAGRDFDDAEWASCRAQLERRGLVDADGLTDQGRRVADAVELTTDELAARAYDVLDDEADELCRLLEPITRAVATDIPRSTPIGLEPLPT